MTQATDLFLSHNWGEDESGRDNHYRVSLINKELKELGYTTWLDEEHITGGIADDMSQGIEQTKGVIVFVTQRYNEKVTGKDTGDNCQLEFNYASRRKTRSKIVAVVMEECMLDTIKWTGVVGMHLGGDIYVDMSGDLDSETYLSEKMKDLENKLRAKGIEPGTLCSYFTFLVLWSKMPKFSFYKISN